MDVGVNQLFISLFTPLKAYEILLLTIIIKDGKRLSTSQTPSLRKFSVLAHSITFSVVRLIKMIITSPMINNEVFYKMQYVWLI